jgi:hypothetical protein
VHDLDALAAGGASIAVSRRAWMSASMTGAAVSSPATCSSSARDSTARVPSAVTRWRKISRTALLVRGVISAIVASACWASAPPTPPRAR